MASTDDFESIAAELSVLAPDAFVDARDARARAVADPVLAKRVRGLRKPSVAAWIVNILAHERGGMLEEAVDLADELRTAQDEADGPELARLSGRRRTLTARLAQQAAALAEGRGHKVTGATRDAVQQTLSAMFFDADAAAAVVSGRLVRALGAAGEETDRYRDAVAGSIGGRPPVRRADVDELAERRRRRAAERALATAEAAVRDARSGFAQKERAREAAERSVAEIDRRLASVEAELGRLRHDAEHARALLGRLAAERGAAVDAVEQAERAATAARHALEQV